MRKNLRTSSVLFLAVMMVLTLVGCPQPEALSSEANLQSITIAGKAPQSLGTPNVDWLEVVHGEIYLSDEELNEAQVSVSVSSGADAWFARGTLGAPPFFDKTTTYQLEHDDVVWVEIFSENLDAYNIYGFRVHKRTPMVSEVNFLREATINTMFGNSIYSFNRAAASKGNPKAAIAEITDADCGELWIGASEFAGTPLAGANSTVLSVSALPELLDTDLRMTIASNNAGVNFASPNLDMGTVNPGDFLYIESKSGQGERDVLYYKIKLVEKNDNMDINVTINEQAVTPGTIGWHSFAGSEYYSFALGDAGYHLGAKLAPNNGSVALIADTSAPVTINAAAATGSGITKIEYAHIDAGSRYAAESRLEYSASGNLGNIPNGEWIAVKVTNELGDTAWYRFLIAKGSSDTTLTGIKINGADVTVPQANTTWDGPNSGTYSVPTAAVENSWSDIAVTVNAPAGASVAYGLYNAGFPPYVPAGVTFNNTSGEFPTFTVDNDLYIQVIAENGMSTGYYKIKLTE